MSTIKDPPTSLTCRGASTELDTPELFLNDDGRFAIDTLQTSEESMPFYASRLIDGTLVINIPRPGAKLRSGRAVTVMLFLTAIGKDEFTRGILLVEAIGTSPIVS